MADFIAGEWGGLKALYDRIAEVGTQADEADKRIVTRGAAVVEAAAKANFSGSHKKGEPHEGGDKPNVVTGTLRRSIRTDPVVRDGLAQYSTTVAPRVIYARRVELGYQGTHSVSEHTRKIKDSKTGKTRKIKVRAHTRTFGTAEGGGSRAFPFFSPAVRDKSPQLKAIAAEEWRKFLNG